MTNRKKKLSFTMLLVFAVALAGIGAVALAGIGIAAPEYARRDAEVAYTQPLTSGAWEQNALADTYDFGQTLSVPVRKVTVDGNAVTAASVVKYPDGTATTKTEIELTECGIYTVLYTATSGGSIYSDECKFTVKEPAFRVSSEKSSFKYGLYDSIAAGATKAVTTEGLLVELAVGDTFTVGEPIDVRGATKSDILINAFATPAVMGRPDFKTLVFTLTDALDPSVYLRIKANHSPEGNDIFLTYYVAGGNGQPMTGYERWWDKIHIDDGYGASANHTFTGKFSSPEEESALDSMTVNLRYDAEEVAVYVGGEMIIDLDDPRFFTQLWHGFPSGYARLSITADSYSGGNNAAFCISEIRGADLHAKTVEAHAPMIAVDTEYSDMPEAKVGEWYPVPEAHAKDYYSNSVSVETSVYYNYASPAAIDVPVSDGKFAVERKGLYAIVYTCVNKFGKSAERVLWVHAGANIAPVSVTGDNVGKQLSKKLGEWIDVGEITATGGSGNLRVQTSVEFDGKSRIIDGGFRPEQMGLYTVTVSATDYLGQTGSASFTVDARPGNVPVFVDEPNFPHCLIAGGTYVVPECYANDYSSGTCVRKLATVEIDGKTYTAGEEFVPDAEANGDEIPVVFRCEGAQFPMRVKTVKAFVENDGYLDLVMKNYLVGESVATTAYGDYIEVSALASNGSWTFANTLLSENFELHIAGEPNAAYFDALTVRLTDSENRNISVTAKAYKREGEVAVIADGLRLTVPFGYESGRNIKFGFRGKSFVCNQSQAEISKCDNGDAFEGFPSGKVILAVGFENAVSGLARYRLSAVNGQPMSNGAEDRIAPKISVLSADYGGCVSLGSTRVIPRVMAADTLNPACTFDFTVTAPDGAVVTDTSGNKLENRDPGKEYEIRFEQYGLYRVSYRAYDSFSGSYNRWSYLYTVEDVIAPEYHFATEFVSSAKVGEAVAIPDFTVTDNITASEDILVLRYVLNPNGELIKIPDGSNSIVCTKEGVYEFRIMAFDAEGNVNTVRIRVTVSRA